MHKPIDPKYGIRIEPTTCEPHLFAHTSAVLDQILDTCRVQIVKSSSGEPIPDEEPLILFRGRDRLAVEMLRHYRALAVADGCTQFHLDGIDNRIEQFDTFARAYPERMKQPGITRGA